MKRIVLALFLAWALPAAGQTPPADWRAVVSDRDRDFVENWERYFESAIQRAMRPDPYTSPDLNAEELRVRARFSPAAFAPTVWEGRHACRVTTLLGSVYVNDWLHCRMYFDGTDWRLEKRSGRHYFDLRLFPDGALGTVAVGAEWGSMGRSLSYGDDPDCNAVGIAFQAGNGLIQFLFPSTGIVEIIELDLRRRIRNQDVHPRERGRPAAPSPGRGDTAR
jgi:Domain of unknown function (DUF4893)